MKNLGVRVVDGGGGDVSVFKVYGIEINVFFFVVCISGSVFRVRG